ncbi:hypothetical protein [Paenibacillus sp. B01]|uniref:hypothetical protein n=1 Tax=Paenibacillus sp. B01 TaxID=2660554 RepID=UPI00129A3CDE|nr:hypothetical protein [Paenibacillus sp. B01]QGG58030.1 hypothetical protein GE073_22285 [Paenibacillus sp. B01]
MLIRCARVDRYQFDGFVRSSRTAREWMREAERQVPWFDLELFADFFMSFYLPDPAFEHPAGGDPFHRWMLAALRRQHYYREIHPRTVHEVNASFKTALKALMWLTESYEEEARKREREKRPIAGAGPQEKGSGGEEASGELRERLTDKQLQQLQLVGYRLQQGKTAAEDKQRTLDARPLDLEELAALRRRVEELREAMRTDFVRRDKHRAKLAKAEQELGQQERRLARVTAREAAAMQRLEDELGGWLADSLRGSLSREEADSGGIHALLQASQRLANRRWGSELGRLRRQTYEQYALWVERLRGHKELLAFLEEVGRQLHAFKAARKQAASRRAPEARGGLELSGDIARMLPSEASLLADPDYEPYFLMRWLDRKLLTYAPEGREEEPQRGPVICMVDTSHSMRGAKLRLAQAFTAAFAAFTLGERRDFTLLLFGAKGEVLEHRLHHQRPDWDKFYELSRLAYGGGTNFDAPIARGIELVQGARGFAAADFVLLTDGVGEVTPPYRERLATLAQRRGVRLHTLILGSPRQHLARPYDIAGVSHRIRFAAAWEGADPAAAGLLLDVFAPERRAPEPAARRR